MGERNYSVLASIISSDVASILACLIGSIIIVKCPERKLSFPDKLGPCKQKWWYYKCSQRRTVIETLWYHLNATYLMRVRKNSTLSSLCRELSLKPLSVSKDDKNMYKCSHCSEAWSPSKLWMSNRLCNNDKMRAHVLVSDITVFLSVGRLLARISVKVGKNVPFISLILAVVQHTFCEC